MSPFQAELAKYVEVSPSVAQHLEKHFQLMLSWNKTLNLTRITDLPTAVKRHYAESIQTLQLLRDMEVKILDLGTGAGFPGIPMGIVDASREYTLLEGDIRKSAFLKEATRGIPNISVVNKRSDSFTGKVDCVVSRAVNWKDLSQTAFLLETPLVWITSEIEFQKHQRSSTWNVEQRYVLPEETGIIVRMCHVAQN